MKRSKEYKISVILSSAALILFCISLVVGLMPVSERIYSLDKIGLYLGFALLGFSYLLLLKAKTNNENDNS